MASGDIRMDYEATMRAAQSLTNVNELIHDAQSKHALVRSNLDTWEGAAASKGKCTLAAVSDVLGSYDSSFQQFARFFVNAAEQLTASDNQAAQAMQPAWDGAYGA